MLICLDLHVFMLYDMLSMLRSSFFHVFDVRSTCFHVSYHVFVPRSIFPMCCLARSTCFYACFHIYLSFLHVFMLYAMSRSFFLMCRCLDLHTHMLDIMSMVMPCLDLHVCIHVLCSYAYVYAFIFLYAWICVLPCFYTYIHMLRCTFTCLHAYFHAYMCRLVCLHA